MVDASAKSEIHATLSIELIRVIIGHEDIETYISK